MKLKALLVVFMALSIGLNAQGVKKAKHVIRIGCDGWGAYGISNAEIPHLKSLMIGAWSLKTRSVLPSSSAVN